MVSFLSTIETCKAKEQYHLNINDVLLSVHYISKVTKQNFWKALYTTFNSSYDDLTYSFL